MSTVKKEDLITTRQAAIIMECTDETIRNYRRRGWLQPVRLVNGRILLLRPQVERLREELIAERCSKDRVFEVQASQGPAWAKVSLRNDPDPIIFSEEVWEAVRQYQAAKRER